MASRGRICHYYLQGKCRFGENCWNLHPRHGGGGPNQPPLSSGSSRRGGWDGHNQRNPIVQASSFSKASNWHNHRDNGKGFHGPQTDLGFSQNRFAALSSNGDGSSDGIKNEEEKLLSPGKPDLVRSRKLSRADSGKYLDGRPPRNTSSCGGRGRLQSATSLNILQPPSRGQSPEVTMTSSEIIMKDMEVWQSSGQWMFSSYSPMKDKPNISGFPAFSPEELRLEYYNCSANNNIQNYVNSIQQLVTQWRSRLLELKNINASTKTALISELKNVASQPPPAFGFGGQQSSTFRGQQSSTFGTSTFPVNQPSSPKPFSFKSPSELANVSSGNLPAFGSLPGFQNCPTLGAASSSTTTTTTHSVGFGYPAASSAASFSFKSSASSGGFGTSGFSGFGHSLPTSSSNNTSASVLGVSNSAVAAPTLDSRNTLFGQPANAFGSSGAFVSSVTQTNIASEKLFTPKNELSADELKQFEAKKFTLGKIPLKPPPMDLLLV